MSNANTTQDQQPKTFASLLAQKPRGPLYHYTTQSGLLGIFRSGRIWATQVKYLNDASEFQHAVALADGIAGGMVERASAWDRRQSCERLVKGVREAGISICVASFSEHGDDLSQWRAYSKGVGYSIGFSYDALVEAATAAGWILAPCVYGEHEQKKLMTALLEEALAETERQPRNKFEEAMRYKGGNIAFYLNRYAAIFKNKHFEAEQEWRLISPQVSSDAPGFAFREGASTIIPYYELPLSLDKNGAIKLKEIYVGPSPSADLARRAVRSLLLSKQLKIDVHLSEIPYRHW